MPPPQVTVTKPVMYPVQSYHEYNGYLDAIQKVEIRARVKGFLNQIAFEEGKEIAAGTLLYVIDPREYDANLAKSIADIEKAKADIANAQAQIRLAEAEEARQREGYAKGAVPKTDLDKAVATLAANKAQLGVAIANKGAAEAAKQTAELQVEYTIIKSPIAGRINRTLVTKGNLVGQNENTLLTTIVSVDPLYVSFDIPERDLIEYQRGLVVGRTSTPTDTTVPLEIGVATEDGFPHRGRLLFQENRADVGTGTVRLWGQIANPQLGPNKSRVLYPGLFARVRAPVGNLRPLPVIPEDALMTGQEGRFVYVVGADHKVAKRSVTVGTQIFRGAPPEAGKLPLWRLTVPNAPAPSASGSPPAEQAAVRSVVAIEKGLTADDTIVVDGLQKARPGAEIAPDLRTFIGPPPPQ
jgi:RND family efflux transporter MFP subunit